MMLASGNGVNVEIETDHEIINNDVTTIPATEDDNADNTGTTISTTTPAISTPRVLVPINPTTSNSATPLMIERYTPTKLDDWALWQSSWMGTRGSEYFQISFSQNQ